MLSRTRICSRTRILFGNYKNFYINRNVFHRSVFPKSQPLVFKKNYSVLFGDDTMNSQEQFDTKEKPLWKKITYWTIGVVGVIAACIGTFIYFIAQDVASFSMHAQERNKYLTFEKIEGTEYLIHLAHQAFHYGMNKFYEIQKSQDENAKIAASLGDDWKNSPIHLLNGNFVAIPTHTFYVLPTITKFVLMDFVLMNSFYEKNGKIIKRKRMKRGFYETHLDIYFPIINKNNGALGILKVRLKDFDVLQSKRESKKELEKKESDYEKKDLHFEFESISMNNPINFVEVYGESMFNYGKPVEDLFLSFPDEEREFIIHEEPFIHRRIKTHIDSIVAPTAYKTPTPIIGHVLPQYIEELL